MEQRNKRITLYLTGEKLEHIHSVKEALLEDNLLLQKVSTNEMLNIVIEAGLESLISRYKGFHEIV